MDVNELLNYQPSTNFDNLSEAGSSEDGVQRNKKRKVEEIADLNATSGPLALDETALKRLVLQFERKVLKNQEFRVKFADDPSKFMDTEVELFDVLQEFHIVTTQPELYQVIIDLNVLPTLMGLLSHENGDIACSIVALFQEMTDIDNVTELHLVSPLLDALIEGQIVAQLVSNMERLDETVKEEAEGVYNSLSIIENLTDYKPEISKDSQSLLTWILKRLKAKIPFDNNKLYTSEILSILLQNNEENRKMLGSMGGIDALLQQIAHYKRHEATSSIEREYVENIFDSLCLCLLLCPENREYFFKGEGIELMNLILKVQSSKLRQVVSSSPALRQGALKVLSHLFTPEKNAEATLTQCSDKYIEILGLRSLFPVLIHPKSVVSGQKKKKRSNSAEIDDVEEHVLTIILALLRYSKSSNRQRLMAKFVENNLEKTERLLELYFKYSERLIHCDALIAKESATKAVLDEEIDEEEIFMRRLTDGGLFTLQLICWVTLIIACDENESSSQIKERMLKILNMQANSRVNHVQFIRNVLKEMSDERSDEEKKSIEELLEKFHT